ncbi:MAG: site-specific DNA-methyltransferase, partial [Patescibacteria group bacterium]|nr:site-specific DNA-methyltransferase [Patescibacteria group bacterium]
MNKFLAEITKILKKDKRLFSKDDNKLLKGELISLITKDDEKLLELLATSKEVEKRFFKKVGKLTIFQKENFLQLVTMNEFLPDSFTAFEVSIGLTDNKKFISAQDDVSLVFPHKDCILEGGQDKEDVGRNEIFYNTVLAPDEIDRLKEPKVLTNWKKFDKNGQQKLKEISQNDNLIIKGNNLLALYSLLQNYRNKVKLIYIDPPYNTGNDEFKYNDSFNHSSWLTFMKNRLEIARELLINEGCIFIQIDNNEHSYLKVLMDEIFGYDNFRNNIIWRKLLSAKKQSFDLSNITEHILVYSKTKEFNINKVFIKAEEAQDLKNYPYLEEKTKRKYGSFDFTQKGQGEPRVFKSKLLTPPKGKHWIWDQEKISKGIKDGKIIFTKNGIPRVKRYLDEKDGNPLSDLWSDEEVKIISANDKERLIFDGQKPESLLRRIMNISTSENDLVLDYHAGTGTTGAVAHKMNRRYILIEQMDYIHELPEARLINVINGDKTGISKDVDWKGGGSFVYTELLEWNNKYIRELKSAKTKSDIKKIRVKIEKEQFYKYQIETDKFDN